MKYTFIKPAMLAGALLLALVQQAVAENPFDMATSENYYRDGSYIVTQTGTPIAMDAGQNGQTITLHGGGKLMDSSRQNMDDKTQNMVNMGNSMSGYEGQTCGGYATGAKSSYGANPTGCGKCGSAMMESGESLANGSTMGSDGQYGTGGSALDRAGADYEQAQARAGWTTQTDSDQMAYTPMPDAAMTGYQAGTKSSVRSQDMAAGMPGTMDSMNMAGGSCAAQNELRMAMHKLWEDHVTWTRVFIIDAAADLPDQQLVVNRLMQNQVDIGNAIKPYYGAAAGNQLTSLLKEHIAEAGDVVAAAKAGDQGKLADANRKWFANADAIAAFLGQANPQYWPEATVKQMMHDHLNLTTEEATARLQGDWNADIAAYDKVHEEILTMADALTDGIVGQFPQKFQ